MDDLRVEDAAYLALRNKIYDSQCCLFNWLWQLPDSINELNIPIEVVLRDLQL